MATQGNSGRLTAVFRAKSSFGVIGHGHETRYIETPLEQEEKKSSDFNPSSLEQLDSP